MEIENFDIENFEIVDLKIVCFEESEFEDFEFEKDGHWLKQDLVKQKSIDDLQRTITKYKKAKILGEGKKVLWLFVMQCVIDRVVKGEGVHYVSLLYCVALSDLDK